MSRQFESINNGHSRSGVDDFLLKQYDWAKTSHYAVTEDGVLLKYVGDDLTPMYECLFEGYWEVTDAGIGYAEIENAKPVTEEWAKKIIRKEEKPRETRPPERNNWIH